MQTIPLTGLPVFPLRLFLLLWWHFTATLCGDGFHPVGPVGGSGSDYYGGLGPDYFGGLDPDYYGSFGPEHFRGIRPDPSYGFRPDPLEGLGHDLSGAGIPMGGSNVESSSPFNSKPAHRKTFAEVVSWFQRYACEDVDSKALRYQVCAQCYDDAECSLFQDCCPGRFLKEKIQYQGEPPLSCPSILEENLSYFMETSCLPHLEQTEIGHKCRNSSLFSDRDPPVTDMRTEISYRNRFCALCNDVTVYKTWSLLLDCTQGNMTAATSALTVDELLTRLQQDRICKTSLLPPDGVKARMCTPPSGPLTSSCNVTGRWRDYDERVVKACAAYKLPYKDYRNVFCQVCNDDLPWNQYGVFNPPSMMFLPLTAVLDLTDDRSAGDGVPLDEEAAPEDFSRSCDAEQYLDPASMTCRRKTCSKGKVLQADLCRSVLTKAGYLGYNVSFFVSTTTELAKLQNISENLSKLDIFISTTMFGVFSFTSRDFKGISITCNGTAVTVEWKANWLVETLAAISIDETNRFWMAAFKNSTGSFHPLFGNVVLSLTGPSRKEDDMLVSGCPNFTKIFSDLKLNYARERRAPSDDGRVKIWMLPFTPLSVCSQTALSAEEFVFSEDTNSLMVKATNASLQHPYFLIEGDQALVCLEDYLAGFQQSSAAGDVPHERKSTAPKGGASPATPLSTTGGLVSFSCSLVSLLSLAFTLLAFILFKDLRTIAGLCCACMVGVLFLAQAVFEFGAEQTEYEGVCIALGVLAHYLWLSSTFWMNACTVLLFYRLMFPLRAMVALHSRAKMLAQTSAYAFVSPAVIVGSVVGSSLLLYGDTGYGGSACYIRRITTRRYALALPVGLLVLINVCLFLIVIVHLRRGTLASSKSNKVSVFACTKLSVITGLSWLAVFLYEGLRYEVIAYVAMVLFGLQGVVVFLVFAFGHYARAFRSWSQRMKSVRNKPCRSLSCPLPQLQGSIDKQGSVAQ